MADDDVPKGFTLITPGVPQTGGDDVPKGFTLVTPGGATGPPPGGGVLQNPGGDLNFASPGAWGTEGGMGGVPPTPAEQQSLTGFAGNVLTSGANLLSNVAKTIVPLDATNANDAIPLKRASDHLFDLFTGAGRALRRTDAGQWAANKLGLGELPDNPQADQAVTAFHDYVMNRYGSWDKFENTLYHDPVGVGADLSVIASGGSAAADMAGLGRTASVLGKIGEVANPLYVPGKIVSGAVKLLGPKEIPAFDPRSATFEGETPPAAQQPETNAEAVRRLQQDWGIKIPQGGLKPPGAAPAAAPAAAAPTIAQNIRGILGSDLGRGAAMGVALDYLTHHLTGAVLRGGLTAGALTVLPKLLRSSAGQQMLAAIGPGSTPARAAAAVQGLVPALNTLYQSQQQQPVTVNIQPWERARGGTVNPVLARIQRERLRLPGIAETLSKRV